LIPLAIEPTPNPEDIKGLANAHCGSNALKPLAWEPLAWDPLAWDPLTCCIACAFTGSASRPVAKAAKQMPPTPMDREQDLQCITALVSKPPKQSNTGSGEPHVEQRACAPDSTK
jgi:hypothetical protein